MPDAASGVIWMVRVGSSAGAGSGERAGSALTISPLQTEFHYNKTVSVPAQMCNRQMSPPVDTRLARPTPGNLSANNGIVFTHPHHLSAQPTRRLWYAVAAGARSGFI